MHLDAPPTIANRRAEYEESGYLIVRNLFGEDEVAAAAAEADELLKRTDLIDTGNIRCRWQPHVQTGDCLFETFDPVLDLAPICGGLATDDRLLRLLGDLYGEPACLFKDKLIFKPPGAKGHGLHQDFIAWPGFPRSFLTVVVPLDPCNKANGCTEVFADHHRSGCLSPEDGQYHELPDELIDPARGVLLELEPGDVAIFGGFTPHRSAPNRTDGSRRQLYLSYNAFSDGGEQRLRHYREFHAWLREQYAKHGRTGVYFQ